MVEQYSDPGLKGAVWLAIVPSKERNLPLCTKAHDADEKVIVYPEWTGYFKGAKDNFVIFHAPDGVNGGMPFVIYDSRSGKQLFRDTYFYAGMWTRKFAGSPFNDLRVNVTAGGQVFLKYLRVEEADCDLHLERVACWEKVKKKFELKSTPMPVCTGYKGITTRYESAVACPIEVSLYPQPSKKTIGGPARCWPVD